MEMTLNERLISAVQRRPALYDKTDINYSNRNFLNQQWKEIALEVDCDERRTRKKWTKLRDYFQRNHRLMTTCKTGRLAPEQRKKKWFLYDSLTFLLPHLRDKETQNNLSDESDGSHDIDDGSQSLDGPVINSMASISAFAPMVDTEETLPRLTELNQEPLHKRPRYSQEKYTSAYAAFDPQIVAVKSTGEDEDEQYFRSLIPKMKLLGPIAKMECQMEIHSVVLKYLKRTLGPSGRTRPIQTLRSSDHTTETKRSLNHTQSLPDNQSYGIDRTEYDNNLSASYLHYYCPQKTENVE